MREKVTKKVPVPEGSVEVDRQTPKTDNVIEPVSQTVPAVGLKGHTDLYVRAGEVYLLDAPNKSARVIRRLYRNSRLEQLRLYGNYIYVKTTDESPVSGYVLGERLERK
jgi:hypothetical protein